MLNFINDIGREVLIGVIVGTILSVGGFLFKWFSGRRATQPLTEPPTSFQNNTPRDTSGRALWALGLGLGSYLMWFIPPLPILIPFALTVSLWLGLTSRQHTPGKVAATASCLHLILVSCGIVVLVLAMITSSTNNSNTSGLLICYDQYYNMYYYC